MNCKNKTIVITGGSAGYGYGMAKKLKAKGAVVFITGRHKESLEKAARELDVTPIVADVCSAADWDHIFAATSGKIDVLINNAGAGIKIAPLTEYSDDEIAQAINTNLTGVLFGCRRAAKIMTAQQSGLIINISSVCAHYGWPGFAAYTAAKAGLDMMSRALYTELRPSNVRVTVLTPSWGATNWGVAAGGKADPDEVNAKKMSPDQMGDLITQICESPDHLVFPEIMVQPLIQEIIPF